MFHVKHLFLSPEKTLDLTFLIVHGHEKVIVCFRQAQFFQ